MANKKNSTGRPTTRATNANQHPGAPDQIKKRRTKAEIARDKAQQEEDRYQKKRQETESINRIAELEDQMALDDASAENTHPRNQKDVNQGELRGKRKTDVKNSPSEIVRTEEKTAQHTNQKSAVSGPTLANQKRKRGEENVSSDDETAVMVVATRIPKKGDTSTKQANQKRKKGEENISSGDEPVTAIATRIPKKNDTGTKEANQKQKKREENISSEDGPVTAIVTRTKHGKVGTSEVQQDAPLTRAPSQNRPRHESYDETSELTDLNHTPEKKGTKLKRSYAIADIADLYSNTAEGEHESQVLTDEYEPQNRPESYGHAADEDLSENEPTPKKKQKKIKVPVREAINANRKEREPRKAENKVCDDSISTSTKTSKAEQGPVASWVDRVTAEATEARRSRSVLPRSTVSSKTVSASRRTNTSNAVVVSSKSKIPDQDSNHHQAGHSHGFLEEDEHEERKAALSSPIKGNKRLSSAAIVKVEHATPPPAKRVTAGRKEKFTNAHLPPGCQDNGAWRRILIPTYLQYLGSRDSDKHAWALNDDGAMPIQQEIWNFVYGNKVPHIITVQGPVFALIDQRVCEWRGGFASAALSIVNAFFDANDYDSDESRQEFAASALESWEFLYRDVSTLNDGEIKRKGIFGGPFVVQTFTTHFSATQGAIRVPSIGDLGRPFIALALSAAAVERALTLWKDGSVSCETVSQQKAKKRSSAIIKTINKATGKESSKTTDFNQANWATVTDSYLLSIKKALSSESKFDLIIKAAKSFLKITTRTGDTTTLNDTSAEQNRDERAFLCDDPDSD